MNNYIFDLDGTIINSLKEVLVLMEKAFEKANYPLDKKRLTQNIIGPPLKEIVQILAPELKDENKIQEIIKHFSDLYDNDMNDKSEVYEGVYEVLGELKKSGKRLFMATLKPVKPTVRIINQFHLDYFEEIYTIDMYGNLITKEYMIKTILEKYNLKKSETCMVGDSVYDMTAAKENKITAIGVLWGYGDNKIPLKENADTIISSMFELCNIT